MAEKRESHLRSLMFGDQAGNEDSEEDEQDRIMAILAERRKNSTKLDALVPEASSIPPQSSAPIAKPMVFKT